MECDDAIQPNFFMEFAERPVVAFVAAQIVASRKRMFGIEAQPQPIILLYQVIDPFDLLEAETEIAALPGGDLNRDFGLVAGACRMGLVERPRDCRDPRLFTRADVRSRMGNQKWHAQRLAAFQ